jgi:UPF0042 nucleotide-binding protein
MSKPKKPTAAARARPIKSARRAKPRRILMVTGVSGAGHSTALKALEDLGYEAVDNLPLFLLSGLTADTDRAGRPIAIGVDSRTRDFSVRALTDWLARLKSVPGREVRLVFLDCSDEALRRRFTETRSTARSATASVMSGACWVRCASWRMWRSTPPILPSAI